MIDQIIKSTKGVMPRELGKTTYIKNHEIMKKKSKKRKNKINDKM